MLEPVLVAVPVEAAHVIQPDEGPEPGVTAPIRRCSAGRCRCGRGRLEFYSTCREPDLAVCVATGDNRLYANILRTIGYIPPSL